jgi:NAD(P)-dependent dehydrogenase (short-subunit alcohol dehydrogenase family)
MDIARSTALVTGANRGLGRHLARELVAPGATVYAAARTLTRSTCPAPSP